MHASSWRTTAAGLILVLSPPVFGQAPQPLRGDDLVAALQNGGHVIYIRHAKADVNIDQDAVGLGACVGQRQLASSGRADAQSIGDGFRRLSIPIGRVLSSPYCRAIETGGLAFGTVEVEHDLRLWHGQLDAKQREELPLSVSRRLGDVPPRGRTTVIVAHSYRDVLGFDIGEGEAAVFRPAGHNADGGGRFTLLARLKPADWAALPLPMPERVAVAYAVPKGWRPDIVVPADDGMIWHASSGSARLGRLNAWLGTHETIALPVGTQIVALALAENRSLWAADAAGRLLRIDAKTREVETAPLPRRLELQGMVVDRRGQVWIAADELLYRAIPAPAPAAARIDVLKGPNRIAKDGLALGRDGQSIVVLSPDGLFRIDTETAQTTTIPVPREIGRPRRLSGGAAGEPWLIGDAGWLEVEGRRRSMSPINPRGGGPSFAVDWQGALWRSGGDWMHRIDARTGEVERQALPRGTSKPTALATRGGELWAADPQHDRLILIRRR
jgi:streptogramin lyase/phosphohistidine phosphatase SixA